jgi:6-phosphogluconolactonase
MFKPNLQYIRAKASLIFTFAVLFTVMTAHAAAAPRRVYTMTNSSSGNAVVMYSRSAHGTLGEPQSFPTGGSGTGAGLGSQGALVMSDNGHWLIAANAGSNDVTVFSTRDGKVTVTDRQASGGVMPISIALDGDLVFILNAGAPANITGFELTPRGALVPIPGSTRVLPGAAPAQVSFANHGTTLVVTEKNSNTITVYAVDDDTLSGPFTQPSSGMTPFGFGVSRSDLLIVSNAAGGAPGGSSVSSYFVEDEGPVQPVTAALRTGETAACWVAVTRNGKYAYIANTGSSTISSISVRRDGSLRLLEAVAGRTPAGTPAIDLDLSVNSKYLYSLAGGTISVFRVSRNGNLARVQVVTGLPSSTAGLAAR